ncbi:hypothetical protein SORBI_3003G261900 [Sorghum bicolor]|jgi:hypothetical protein|uniref:Uncharacterized protein n=1 Tax=Sorghum bicolor TaxID=4558 RepID=A0A1W0VYZ1_SORBI|nr:hypothetical protein SORBI_3003G261900 [Sorghum bicolor]
MVLMAAVENDYRRGAKVTSAQSNSMGPAPRPSSSSRARLHDFSFPTLSWGTHRVLRCSKNGPASSSPASPEPPSPDKEKAHRPEGGGSLTLQRQRQRAARRPWNLRTRRSATAATTRQAGSDDADEAAQAAVDRAPTPTAEAKKRAFSFSIALSKQEIAEDFAAIRGTRPPRRPKKRPRTVQRQLDVRISNRRL